MDDSLSCDITKLKVLEYKESQAPSASQSVAITSYLAEELSNCVMALYYFTLTLTLSLLVAVPACRCVVRLFMPELGL